MATAHGCGGWVLVLALSATAAGQTDSQVAVSMGSYFYTSNSTYTDTTPYVWPTATPASQGFNASTLAAGSAALSADPDAASLLVIRGNKLVHESYFNGATAGHAKNIHSASKPILSTLVGIAINEGRLSLDTKIGAVLPHTMPAQAANITVRNLLTMKSGWDWEEDETEYTLGSNPVQSIVNLPLAHAPGTSFNYSTGDSHVLGAVLATAAGNSLHHYAKTRLFTPLGIDAEKWGRDGQGYFSGGFNFYMTPREVARFGQLILDSDQGRSAGTSIVPQAWVESATTPNSSSPSYHGYYWWLDANMKGQRGYRAWGWGKQFVYVFPNLELVTVITHDTAGDDIDDADLNSFVNQYILGAIVGTPGQPLPGDVNNDGNVNALDYVTWRSKPGTTAEYNEWRANYGDHFGTGTGVNVSVPEPTGALMAAIALLMGNVFARGACRKRRR